MTEASEKAVDLEALREMTEKATQADRDAAARLVRAGCPGLGNGNKVIADEIKGGLHDDYLVVQAFVEHRHQLSKVPTTVGEGVRLVKHIARIVQPHAGWDRPDGPQDSEDERRQAVAIEKARTILASLTSPVAGEDVEDQIREAVITAYIAGAKDVHEHWQEDADPEFTEAAHDYAAEVLAALKPSALPEGGGGEMKKGPHYGRLLAERKFVNEIGNTIKIVIEDGAPSIGAFHRIITIAGPQSKITSGLTIRETEQLFEALAHARARHCRLSHLPCCRGRCGAAGPCGRA